MDLTAWLRELGLEQYADAFRANNIDARVLPNLTADDLREIGVASVGHRRTLLQAIAALGASDRNGAPASQHGRPVPPGQAERRQLTVMFVDLVGSTVLSGRLDPEEMGAVLRTYQDTVAGEIVRFEGHVAKFMGDGVLAYFGWPRAHEDEAERAVRAGLAIAEVVGRAPTPSDEPLAVRVGIATGLVVVGDLVGAGAAREEAVVGETPNLAARLQQLADPGTVVVAERTRRLLGGAFDCAEAGIVRLKGFAEPVPVFRVLRPSQVAGRFESLRGESATPLVGRDEELRLLLARWERAKADEGQVVLLSGEPGIGKSRLVLALRERVRQEQRPRWRYQCSPYHTSSALHPVVQHLERAAGLGREDSAEVRLAKLRALLGGGENDPRQALPLLAELLGIPTGELRVPAEITPQERKVRTLKALFGQLEATAANTPLLLVLEDAHWIDPTTQELFDLLVERTQHLPVLLVVTFRPEYRPSWTGHAHVTLLTLNRLAREDAAAVSLCVAGKPLPPPVLAEILRKTDGVPLFIEELTKTVTESGLLRDAHERYALDGTLPPLAIPTTLHDSLLARLDRLAPAKEVAQVGAVIGREFSHALLAAVAPLPPDRLAAALDELVASELIFRRGGPPEATYVFKHALVQDAAYGTLLKSRRRQLHARVAEKLERNFPQIVESQPEILAHHCTEAGLFEKAIGYWYKAGLQATARSAMTEAERQLFRGLELLTHLSEGPNRDLVELNLQIALGGALTSTKGWAAPEIRKSYERALDLCKKDAQLPQRLIALSRLYDHHAHGSNLKIAYRIGKELLSTAEQHRHIAGQARAHRQLGVNLIWRGRLDEAASHLECALGFYASNKRSLLDPLWGTDPRLGCRLFMGLRDLLQGSPQRGVEQTRAALAAADDLGHPATTSMALFLNCWVHQVRAEPKLVLRHALALDTLAKDYDFPHWAADATFLMGWVLAADGEMVNGAAEMCHGLAALQVLGIHAQVPYYCGLLAELETRRGNLAEAQVLLHEASAVMGKSGERWFEAELHRLRGKALLGSRDDGAEVEICFCKAIAVAQEQGAKWWELRAARSLARLWAERGERQRAFDLLAPVCGGFTEGLDLPDLQGARTLLGELN